MKQESDANRMLRQQREWNANKQRQDAELTAAIGGAPQKRKLRWWQIVLAVFFGLVVLGALVPKPSDDRSSISPGAEGAASTASQSGDGAAPTSIPSKWTYGDYKDEMRGTQTRMAAVRSENSVDLEFPYGEQTGKLTVQRDPKSGLDVVFSVEKGQILCHGFGDSYVSAKFDDGPIQKFRCSGASDGSANYAFLRGADSFLKKLKGAKRTVIEAEFFQQGQQQFVFETTGLEWK